MIVTLTENSRIESAWPGGWVLARRPGGNFALAGIPGAARRLKAFEPFQRFGSLPEAFTAALRLGIAMPGQTLDLATMNHVLREIQSDPIKRRALTAAAWDRAGRMRVTLGVAELGEYMAGIAGELTATTSADQNDAEQSAKGVEHAI